MQLQYSYSIEARERNRKCCNKFVTTKPISSDLLHLLIRSCMPSLSLYKPFDSVHYKFPFKRRSAGR